MEEAGKIGTTLGSFVIVGVSVFAMIFELLRSYEEQRKQLLSLSEDLNFAANHDPLTRLYNRRYLVNQVNEWICKPEKSFWIVLMDVDDFKAVNDTYGHGYGDDVLREAGRLIFGRNDGKRNRSPVRRRGVYLWCLNRMIGNKCYIHSGISRKA